VLEGRAVCLDEIGERRKMQAGSIDRLSDERIDTEFTYGMERAAPPGAGFPGARASQHSGIVSSRPSRLSRSVPTGPQRWSWGMEEPTR